MQVLGRSEQLPGVSSLLAPQSPEVPPVLLLAVPGSLYDDDDKDGDDNDDHGVDGDDDGNLLVGPPLHNGHGHHLRLFCLHLLWRTTYTLPTMDNLFTYLSVYLTIYFYLYIYFGSQLTPRLENSLINGLH